MPVKHLMLDVPLHTRSTGQKIRAVHFKEDSSFVLQGLFSQVSNDEVYIFPLSMPFATRKHERQGTDLERNSDQRPVLK